MTKCWSCGEENLTGDPFCTNCGAKMDGDAPEPTPVPAASADPAAAPAAEPPKRRPRKRAPKAAEAAPTPAATPAPPAEPQAAAPAPVQPAEPAAAPAAAPPKRRPRKRPPKAAEAAPTPEPTPEPTAEPTPELTPVPAEEAAPVEAEGAAEPPTPKVGYLVFPDKTERPISESQWLIGRADLAPYISDTRANEISRGHITVYQEGDKFFVEDGKTMVQDKPSSNKTWLIRNGARSLVTGKGRNELENADEIDLAELVKLQFVAK